MRDRSDYELIEMVKNGQIEAVEELFMRHAETVLNTIYPITGDQEKSEDIVQDTFLLIIEKSHTYHYKGNVRAWITKIAINLTLGELRRQKKEVRTGYLTEEPPFYGQNEVNTAVIDLLQKLPEEIRLAITLKKIKGYTYEECSEMLDIPTGTVQTRVFQGMKRLKELVSNENSGKDEDLANGRR